MVRPGAPRFRPAWGEGGMVGWGVLRAPWPPSVLRLPCSPVGNVSPTGTEASSSPKTPSTLDLCAGLINLRTWEEAQREDVRQEGVMSTWVQDLSAPLLQPFLITIGAFLLPLKSLFLLSQHPLLLWFSLPSSLPPSLLPFFLPSDSHSPSLSVTSLPAPNPSTRSSCS